MQDPFAPFVATGDYFWSAGFRFAVACKIGKANFQFIIMNLIYEWMVNFLMI